MTNYYTALDLDPAADSATLTRQLTARIDQTAPSPELHQLEQARAIVGDPAKRRTYDARLRDPAAPPWTPQELHELALALPQRGNKIASLLSTRALAISAAALVAVLALLIGLVACNGGDDEAPVASDNKVSPSSHAQESPTTGCSPRKNNGTEDAEWSESSSAPDYTIALTDQFPLPPELKPLSDKDIGKGELIVQYQDRSIGVAYAEKSGQSSLDVTTTIATYDQQGKPLATKVYDERGKMPETFDLMEEYFSGYFQITAKKGIEIPAVAGGTKPSQNFAMTIRPDAFDDNAIWVLMKGGSNLYKAQLYRNTGGGGPCYA